MGLIFHIKNFEFSKMARIGFRVSAISKRKSIQEAVEVFFNLLSYGKKELTQVGSAAGFRIINTIFLLAQPFGLGLVLVFGLIFKVCRLPPGQTVFFCLYP